MKKEILTKKEIKKIEQSEKRHIQKLSKEDMQDIILFNLLMATPKKKFPWGKLLDITSYIVSCLAFSALLTYVALAWI